MDKYKIYPKQFRNAKIPIEKNRCFFIMPFSEEFDIVYGELKSLLGNDGYNCIRDNEVPGSTPIINKVITEILKAQFIIVDLTNCNPNVFYELGIAHTFKDAENIFLLKQKGSSIPFDITHLAYHDYEINNLRYVAALLKQSLHEKKSLSEFDDILSQKGIIDYLHENQDEFVDVLHNMLSDDMVFVIGIMQGSCSFDNNQIENIISSFEQKLKNYALAENKALLSGLFKFYTELLIACSAYYDISFYITRFVNDFFADATLNIVDVQAYKIDFILQFANANCCLNIVMPWIVQYFRNSKFGTIDLNRYKLESFLLTTDNKDVNNIIGISMTDKDCHVREHFADIIGEKRLIEANHILCKQLANEKNYFTAASIIEAMGKLEIPENVTYINEWLTENINNILETKSYFVLKHIRIALSKLDSNARKSFDENYLQYLSDFIN